LDAAECFPSELKGLWFRSLRRKDKEYRPWGDFPPLASGGVFGRVGEAIVVQADAKVGVGGKGGLAGDEKSGNSGRTDMELFDELGEPAGELAMLGGEGGEPQLPVETGLERGDLGRESVGWPGLVFEYDGLPLNSVGTPFEGEFRATDGHDRKEAVSGGKMPRSENSFPRVEGGYAGAGHESGSDEQQGKGKGKL